MILLQSFKMLLGQPAVLDRVTMVREKSGKNHNVSRSGKSQGIL